MVIAESRQWSRVLISTLLVYRHGIVYNGTTMIPTICIRSKQTRDTWREQEGLVWERQCPPPHASSVLQEQVWMIFQVPKIGCLKNPFLTHFVVCFLDKQVTWGCLAKIASKDQTGGWGDLRTLKKQRLLLRAMSFGIKMHLFQAE